MSSAIPLVDVSRSPSPYPRSRPGSATQSDDEDDFAVPPSLRPLVHEQGEFSNRSAWKRVFLDGGFGAFLLSTWGGLQFYVAFLVFAVAGCEFALVVLNRLILLTGVYKFPYPLTATWIQLVIAHVFFLLAAGLTRLVGKWLVKAGLGAAVAPSRSPSKRPGALQLEANRPLWVRILFYPFLHRFGGIAGGGIFEFDLQIARQCLLLAVVFIGKIILSNISFAYAVLPVYTLSRVGTTPTTLLFTTFLTGTNHSVPVLSAALTSTFTLLIASVRKGSRVTWESILAGTWSTVFVSVYPIILMRTVRVLADMRTVPRGSQPPEVLLDIDDPYDEASGRGTPNATRHAAVAYWRVVHYVSVISLAVLTPLVILSGELGQIQRNCYFLDVPWFWFLTLLGGLSSFAVFLFYFLLVKATSPLSANFVSVPRGAFQLAMLSGKMPAHAWVGVGVCWASSVWYALIKRNEARSRGKMRLEAAR
ncbi:hypothetical protein P152DRAFT_457772 [Eremomyces bilateralis CBS 781.70]|uniref:GDP-mannose transporter n=1 Tax=Eremomyces bilateralis CBS 781.70 TaxID=1392243 RepID=A0A6G1G5T8_9PEZI|nr:uncharacterized protein P152DRAFT_457772 [Eremomyces bilateralis CBS 781.70]KAF1813414.1 hypothetical protein P152DRAFT_457772 [Eremomyces bilateralis CBS 781.70]